LASGERGYMGKSRLPAAPACGSASGSAGGSPAFIPCTCSHPSSGVVASLYRAWFICSSERTRHTRLEFSSTRFACTVANVATGPGPSSGAGRRSALESNSPIESCTRHGTLFAGTRSSCPDPPSGRTIAPSAAAASFTLAVGGIAASHVAPRCHGFCPSSRHPASPDQCSRAFENGCALH
jgi:hypothetical protein